MGGSSEKTEGRYRRLPVPTTPYSTSLPLGIPFLFLEASDGDAPGTANSDLRFHILNQSPVQPSPDMFQLDPRLGALALSPRGKNDLGLMGERAME